MMSLRVTSQPFGPCLSELFLTEGWPKFPKVFPIPESQLELPLQLGIADSPGKPESRGEVCFASWSHRPESNLSNRESGLGIYEWAFISTEALVPTTYHWLSRYRGGRGKGCQFLDKPLLPAGRQNLSFYNPLM